MSQSVVEVGPATIRGAGALSAELAETALDCIDDDIALIDDRPVSVSDLWRDVLLAAGTSETTVLVLPTWWSAPRVARIREAAPVNATVLQRFQALSAEETVVELSHELVVIIRNGAIAAVIPRAGDVVEAVAAEIDPETAVLVDAPPGVDGAFLADELRARGIAAAVADQDWAVPQEPPAAVEWCAEMSACRRGGGIAVLAGTLAAAAAVWGAYVAGTRVPPPNGMPMTLLVEGRVGVSVPARWTVHRITSGPGSARVQVVSPSDEHAALHITQSPIPPEQTLQAAFDAQPDGVFVDLKTDDRRAGRPVITYREIRAGHTIEWVLIHDELRIGIGCQAAPGREQLVQGVCEEAIRSAHAVF